MEWMYEDSPNLLPIYMCNSNECREREKTVILLKKVEGADSYVP